MGAVGLMEFWRWVVDKVGENFEGVGLVAVVIWWAEDWRLSLSNGLMSWTRSGFGAVWW